MHYRLHDLMFWHCGCNKHAHNRAEALYIFIFLCYNKSFFNEHGKVTLKKHKERKLVARLATLLQRINTLYDEGNISRSTRDQLQSKERYTRGALELVKTKLGESFDDFVARSNVVARCRGKQHRWDSVEINLGRMPMGGVYYETERCDNCGKVRVTVINGIGMKDRTFYIDPPGFTMKGVKTSKADWKVLLRRMTLEHEIMNLEQGINTEAEDGKVVPIRAARTA